MSPANAAAGSKRKAADDASSNKKPRADGNIAAFFGAKTGASSSGGGGGGGGGSSGGTTSAFKGNASASAPAEPPMFKFNKQQWLAKLSDEQRELLRLEIDTLHESWLGALADELVSASFLELKRFLRQEKERGVTVYPPEQDIYSWYV
jgi:uracil-DNA glycosylase